MEGNNYHNLLTQSPGSSVLDNIKEVRFSVDVMVVSIRFKGISRIDFLNLLDSRFQQTNGSWESYTSSKAWAGLFRGRTYFDVGDKASMIVLTEKARALSNLDALLVLNSPTPKTIKVVQRFLEKQIRDLSFALAGCELAFDFLTTDSYALLRLQEVIKSTSYFAYARVAFNKGNFPTVTNYINSRKSIKQLRVYVKNEEYQCLRVEFDINRRKANQQGLQKPLDLLNYKLGLLDELKFYRIDHERIKRTLFDSNCGHYFSSQILSFLRTKGFHQAHVWAKSQMGCPRKCQYHNSRRCRHTLFASVRLSGKEMFELIQNCPHAKRLINFRRDYTVKISDLKEVKRVMKKAFKKWKN